jgi:glycosyltransferase involved in cell wall biosynthesis
MGGRLSFPFMVRKHVLDAARAGRPYDIVNVHEPSAAPVTAWRGSDGAPAVVVTSHGLERRAWTLAKEEARLGREGPAWRTRLTYPIASLWPAEIGLRRADHVFCLNFEDQDYLTSALGRRADTVTRIYPAADVLYARAAASRDYVRSDRLLFAGTWRKNKGLEDLVPAVVALAQQHSALTLTVVGAGAPEADVRSRFPEWLQPRILCETPTDEVAMAWAFAEADLFLLPSLFEGTPLTLMQAMMSGLPIVTTATCGMKDVIRHDENGVLVPIRRADAIISAVHDLMTNPSRRERLGRGAKDDALQHYTWDRVAIPVARVYETLQARRFQQMATMAAEVI